MDPCMDDQTAITRLKQGNPDGLEALVRRYQEKALSAAFLITHDCALAEEVTQAAFVRAVEKLHQYNERLPFAPWFFKIVVNQAVKTARGQQRLIPLEEEPGDETRFLPDYLVDPHPQPEQALENEQVKQQVWTALQRLPPEQRAVVVMRYYLEMSESDMADKMKRPISTVKWWLRAARERMALLLKATSSFEDQD